MIDHRVIDLQKVSRITTFLKIKFVYLGPLKLNIIFFLRFYQGLRFIYGTSGTVLITK